MQKLWRTLLVLLAFFTLAGCQKQKSIQATDSADYFSQVMASPEGWPQLSKEEFLEITEEYLSSNEWILAYDKACFYTYGVDYRVYIIDDEYLFFVYRGTGTPSPDGWGCRLDHYADGVVTESESNPHLFEAFLQ